MQIPKIQVIIRKRPLNDREINARETDIVHVQQGTIVVREPKTKLDLTKYVDQHTFSFDGVIDHNVSNQEMYEYYVRPILTHAFVGNKATVFAFGQTGSGKTFTMNGYPRKGVTGLYEYAAHDIFESINHPNFSHYLVSCTFYEVYCGKVFDLLNERTELRILEDKKKDVQVTGGTRVALKSPEELMKYIKMGMGIRVTSKNGTNNESSRSHAILSIQIGEAKRYGEISFIDLAGCERGADTIDQNKQTKVDGAEINKSLLALKECIRAMDANKKHIPFRGSKLTLLLRESFGDNCKTLMIGNISPGNNSCENTLNTLRYSDTVKELKSTKQKGSKEDMKSRELMLTRNQKNTVSITQMEEEEGGRYSLQANRGSLKVPLKRVVTQENNLNFKNIQNMMDKRPLMSNQKSDGRWPQATKVTSPLQPLSSMEYQDWQHSIGLVKNWDIQNQSSPPYQQLVISTKRYLERELQQYFTICQEAIEQQARLNEQRLEILGYMYSNPNQSNEQQYQKSLLLSKINQQKSNLLSKQETKIRDYMSHLELQEECERKIKEAQQINARPKRNDDEMSMIDEIQSEWGDELNSYNYPERVNRPMTRQSLNLLHKEYAHSSNIMKSFDYNPF